jgi:hypothetical protein
MLCNNVNQTILRITTPMKVIVTVSRNVMNFQEVDLYLTEGWRRNRLPPGAALRVDPVMRVCIFVLSSFNNKLNC